MPKNVGDLGKFIVAKGFKKLPKVQKIAQSGHTFNKHQPWSSLVEGDEGSFQPNCQRNLVIVPCELSLLFSNTTVYHLGLFEPSSLFPHELQASAVSKEGMSWRPIRKLSNFIRSLFKVINLNFEFRLDCSF